MSATGLEVSDKTLQTTNTWLKEIAEAACAVFKVLDHHLEPGEMAEVKQNLLPDIRMLFPVH